MTVPPIDITLRKKLLRIQVAVWILFYVFMVLYAIQKWDRPSNGVWSVTIATLAYLLAVYGNAAWLIPRFYQTNRLTGYFLLSAVFLAILVTGRMYAEQYALSASHSTFCNLKLPHFSFAFITILIAY